MRITIESTASEPRYSIKSTVEVGYDDVELGEIYDLVNQVLEGYGFSTEPFEKQGDDSPDDSAPE